MFPSAAGIKLGAFHNLNGERLAENTALELEVPLTSIDENGFQVLLKKAGQDPILLQVPGPPKKVATPPSQATPVKAREPILVRADQATIIGSGLADVKKVLFGTAEVASSPVKDGASTSLTLKGLVSARISAEPGSKSITLQLSNGKTSSVILDVVSNITEVLQSQPH